MLKKLAQMLKVSQIKNYCNTNLGQQKKTGQLQWGNELAYFLGQGYLTKYGARLAWKVFHS